MKMFLGAAIKYKVRPIGRIITISLVSLTSIDFDFIMRFIVDIFFKVINKDIKDFSLDNSNKYISILYNDIKLIEYIFLYHYISSDSISTIFYHIIGSIIFYKSFNSSFYMYIWSIRIHCS